jgi:hypothetical protein
MCVSQARINVSRRARLLLLQVLERSARGAPLQSTELRACVPPAAASSQPRPRLTASAAPTTLWCGATCTADVSSCFGALSARGAPLQSAELRDCVPPAAAATSPPLRRCLPPVRYYLSWVGLTNIKTAPAAELRVPRQFPPPPSAEHHRQDLVDSPSRPHPRHGRTRRRPPGPRAARREHGCGRRRLLQLVRMAVNRGLRLPDPF